jgi:hypothetical protein
VKGGPLWPTSSIKIPSTLKCQVSNSFHMIMELPLSLHYAPIMLNMFHHFRSQTLFTSCTVSRVLLHSFWADLNWTFTSCPLKIYKTVAPSWSPKHKTIARFPWQVQLSQGLPHTNSLKKSWEGVNIFFIFDGSWGNFQRWGLYGELHWYIMAWHFIMSCNMILMPHML